MILLNEKQAQLRSNLNLGLENIKNVKLKIQLITISIKS